MSGGSLEPTSKILIAAKTYGHASYCAKKYGFGPLEWLFLDGDHRLIGTRRARVILYENWREHPEADQIKLSIRDRESVTEEASFS